MIRFYRLLDEVQTSLGGFYFSDYFPLMGWVDKFSGMTSQLEKIFKESDSFYQEIIDEHLHPSRPKPEQEDIVDILLKLHKDRLFTVDLSWNHMKAVLMNIFIAGTDTVAATMVWTMTTLMKNPRVMNKAQKKVRTLVGEKCFVDEDDIQKLTYIKALVKESMRLYPAAPLLIPRETLQYRWV